MRSQPGIFESGRPPSEPFSFLKRATRFIIFFLEMPRRGRVSRYSMTASRSEEHTSELQSPCNLVCRLLLEKKKQQACLVRLPARHFLMRLYCCLCHLFLRVPAHFCPLFFLLHSCGTLTRAEMILHS